MKFFCRFGSFERTIHPELGIYYSNSSLLALAIKNKQYASAHFTKDMEKIISQYDYFNTKTDNINEYILSFFKGKTIF